MPTVYYLRVIGCEHDTANRNGTDIQERASKCQEEAYEGLPMHQSVLIHLQ